MNTSVRLATTIILPIEALMSLYFLGHANRCPGHWLNILKKEIITIKENRF